MGSHVSSSWSLTCYVVEDDLNLKKYFQKSHLFLYCVHSWTHMHTLTTEHTWRSEDDCGGIFASTVWVLETELRSWDRALSDPSHWPALELLILLPPPPRFWDDRCAVPRSGIQERFAHAREQSTAWLPPAPETARHEHWTHLWHFEKDGTKWILASNSFWQLWVH